MTLTDRTTDTRSGFLIQTLECVREGQAAVRLCLLKELISISVSSFHS
jgi:hypothetical protein